MEPVNPSVWRRASRNTALSVSAVTIASGEYHGCPPRVVRGSACQAAIASSVNQTDIDHTRTKTKSPQTNGICERFHRTMLDEFYRVAFRKKIYRTIDELQVDLDAWLTSYNLERAHQGRWCYGKTPMHTFLDAIPTAKEKLMAA